MIRASIVVPNWNGKKFLAGCFESLEKQTFRDFEIIMVDNGSIDRSIEYIKERFPKVRIVALTENTGFAHAANIGIKAAAGDFVALLNNDVEADPRWLESLADAASKYPDAGFFASKMLCFKERDIVDSAGDAITWSGRAYNIGRGRRDGADYANRRYVFGACAGAAFYRREVFDKIGLFDEDFFMYLEDVDLSFRAQLAGYKCLLVPEAKVFHIGSGTSGKGSGFVFKLINKNRWHLIYKNFPAQKIILHLPEIVVSEFRYFVAAIVHKFLPQYFSAIKETIRDHPRMVKKRKKIQAVIAISPENMNKMMEGLR